ncbi:MAG: RNA 2',3'-cyclic phosphodiesterase [Chloroflexota bacterium]|nr:RNA 2',3'-cyclic phosphodiesterase [Dehalococcoidia bacterium]MDW8253719.1 RNA 2',3'-cyclic phosphodiesterase [Chloroflexota bacterium]
MSLLDPNEEGPIRAFVGVPVPAAVQEQLTAIQRTIAKTSGRVVKWVAPETMHLTLEFLGEVPRWVLEDIPPVLDEALAQAVAPTLATASIGAFPNWRRPTVLWVGLEGDVRQLQALRNRVASALRTFGFAADPRPFHPHLTIGRLRPKADPLLVEKLVSTAPNVRVTRTQFTLERVVLYRSILLPEGPRHIELRSWPLASPS